MTRLVGRTQSKIKVGLVLLLLSLAVAFPASADETPTACLEAHERAQAQRQDSQLRAARQSLLECGSSACPAALQDDCNRWLGELEADLPTIVVRAADRNGNDLSSVEVYCDGDLCAEQLDGKPIIVDPGTRNLRLTYNPPSGDLVEPITRQLVVQQGEKNRLVEVTFAYPQKSEAADVTTRPIPPLVFLTGGVGVVGLGIAAVSFVGARSDEGDLSDAGCAPSCNPSTAESIDQSDTVALISAGIGVAAITTAVILYLTRPEVSESGLGPNKVQFGFGPAAEGATFGATGQF